MMTLRARTLAVLFLAVWMPSIAMPAAAQAQAAAKTASQSSGATSGTTSTTSSAAIFRFEPDQFWLNLHHFLYVLGRAEAKERDASSEAVAGAPADAEKGLAALNDDERQKWSAAVTAYAGGLSKKDTVFDDTWPALTMALARAGDAPTLANQPAGASAAGAGSAAIDDATRATLEGAAPIYRRVWWPAHRASNQAWRTATQVLVDRHGPAIRDFLTKVYVQSWPAEGYAVQLSMYASWAGAYSTDGQLLVVATNPTAGTSGLEGLETVFHEAMHQWGDAMFAMIKQLASANNLSAPPRLSHALIFFTAGDAVKRVVPAHVPYADAHGLWRGFAQSKPAIDEFWKPYLDGPSLGDSKARDAAIVAILKKMPPVPPTPPTPPASPR
jgi:hypothetical protein